MGGNQVTAGGWLFVHEALMDGGRRAVSQSCGCGSVEPPASSAVCRSGRSSQAFSVSNKGRMISVASEQNQETASFRSCDFRF